MTVGLLFAPIRLQGAVRDADVMVKPADHSASHSSSNNSFARAAASRR